jgi:hypothetical protein
MTESLSTRIVVLYLVTRGKLKMQGLFFVGEIIVETYPRPLRKAQVEAMECTVAATFPCVCLSTVEIHDCSSS